MLIALPLATAATMAAGCSSATRPDIDDGGIAFQCQIQDCTPDPNGVCQHTCTPDPGPRLVDCAGPQQNLEFMMPYIWTFDEPSPMGQARAMYSYTDNTNSIATFVSGNARKTYQPPTAVMPRCWDTNDHSKPSNPMNRAIHIEGGPFLAWGGGVGISVKDFMGITPTVPEDAEMNVAAWEGISFWARRGPDSQSGMRVLVGDKYTDDDIAYLMYRNDPTTPRYCERVRECACLNHQACAPVSVQLTAGLPPSGSNYPNVCVPTHLPIGVTPNSVLTLSYCGQPEVLSAGSMGAGAGSTTQCNTCIESRCDEPYPAYPDDSATPMGTTDPTGTIPQGTDRQFYGKPCTPYTMRSGISSSWCFDPAAGERPAETTEQCGDHWTNIVTLTNEWQFFTVPFNSMRQQGWAKKSAGLDLTAVSVMRFTWDGGWIDYWIDDVAFYRHKPPAQ